MGDAVIAVRNKMLDDLLNLEAGTDPVVKQAQAIKILSDIDYNDRRLEFDIEKEETRKLEKSNEYVYSQIDMELKKIDRCIDFMNAIFTPGQNVLRTILNNVTRVRRDVMGYQFEETGVIGSHTFNNAQKDKYD